ncbi:hypothetical protein BDV98DRAFT_58726 [Pterulicium gracile]|uniref:Uncharacterized protein n=1 Tax=Pterulicium gracile TaxID=1884261 RepID=A0A5C3PZ97_9AGAR|nr:hypothetical protein BDV98DRAFT_58726 [Pterula gracilis]
MSPGVSQDAHSLSSALNTPVVCASIAACSRSVKDATISANDSQNPPQIHDDDGTPAASSHQQSPSPPPPVASPVSITSHQLAQSQIINGETDNAALLETSGPFNATHTVSADITRSEGDEDPLVRANDSQSPTQIHDDDGPPAASSHQQSSFPPPPAPSPVPSTSQHPDQQQALDRKSADAASQDPASRDAAALPKVCAFSWRITKHS